MDTDAYPCVTCDCVTEISISEGSWWEMDLLRVLYKRVLSDSSHYVKKKKFTLQSGKLKNVQQWKMTMVCFIYFPSPKFALTYRNKFLMLLSLMLLLCTLCWWFKGFVSYGRPYFLTSTGTIMRQSTNCHWKQNKHHQLLVLILVKTSCFWFLSCQLWQLYLPRPLVIPSFLWTSHGH